MKKFSILFIVMFLFIHGVVFAEPGKQNKPVGWMSIPAIGLYREVEFTPLVNKQYDLTSLGQGVTLLDGTAWIDSSAYRIVLAGHTPGGFSDLVLLEPGDYVRLWDEQSVEIYEVQFLQIVEVSDTRWLMPTQNETLTLLTCHGEQRLVVYAEKVNGFR